MSKDEKAKYQEMSEKDRDRYEKEMKDLREGKMPYINGENFIT